MKIALVDVDGHDFPNLALSKIASYHKQCGDTVEWYQPLFSNPDRIYASKVFTFTKDFDYFPTGVEVIKGGTGYDLKSVLPEEIENCLPDYSIYPQFGFAYGFLSRGCIRKCPWCVVPVKEGKLRQYDDILRIAQNRKEVVLMDNNFLANDIEFVKEQIEKSIKHKLKIDFNQALDARLVTPEIASILIKAKWARYIRFACDTANMIEPLKQAVKMLRAAGYTKEFFVYVLAKELEESLQRVKNVLAIDSKMIPFVQPYRDFNNGGEITDRSLKDLARWCNRMWLRKSCTFEEYKEKTK